MNSLGVPVPVSRFVAVPRAARANPLPPGLHRLRLIGAQIAGFAAASAALLVGWGWEQVLVLFAHPARAVVLGAGALVFALSVAQTLTTGLSAFRRGQRAREIWFYLFLAGASVLVLSSSYFDGRVMLYLPGQDLTRYVGMTVFVIGAFLATWAQRSLDHGSISGLSIQPDRHLVTRGPFALIRHPHYAGLILMSVGLPLAFLSKIGLLGGLIVLVLFTIRTYREERLLADEFGGLWSRYASATKRLIPWIY